MCLVGPHGYIFQNMKFHVDDHLGNDISKAGNLVVEYNGLILGWYDCAANEAKLESIINTQIPLLYRDPYLDPPRGSIRNTAKQESSSFHPNIKYSVKYQKIIGYTRA